MTSLRLEHIVKDYDGPGGRQPALRDISLEVGDGEALAIVGPSGCGKSTLLKVVAGLEFPTHGRIYYGDLDMTDIKPQDRGVGMVFQDYALYPAMKSKGNLAYYFEHHAYTHEQMEERVRRTAELMGVDFQHLLGRFPETLSGGEQQRVAIARCIVRDPTIFLMDEPIVNLDAKRREQTRIEIKKLLRTFHVTTLYVTHDQQEAIFMGDRLAVMRAGRLQQVGSPNELLEHPANLFVARFLGNPPMNLLEGAIVSEEGRYLCQLGELRLPLAAAWQSVLAVRQEPRITVGLRPREIVPPWELEQAKTAASLCRCPARALTVEALIGEVEVTLELATSQGPAPHLVAVWPEPEELTDLPEEGTELQIGLDPQRLVLFDPHSEQALQTE